jgi:hypothetical protein
MAPGCSSQQPADTPAGEREPDRLGGGLGRLDDERLIVSRDPAGTATRPPGVQARHAHLVEAVDHLAQPVWAGLHETDNRLDASPPAEARTTIERLHLTIDLSVLPPPRRTILWSWRSSSSVSLRTRSRC